MTTPSNLPPLPPGFALDNPAMPATAANVRTNLPPLPPGFTVDPHPAISAPQAQQTQQQQPEAHPTLRSAVDAAMRTITGGVQEVSDTLKGLAGLPHLFSDPQDSTERKIAALGPLSLATFRVGRAVVQQLEAAKAARDSESSTAGKILATAENYPLVGDVVQQMERGDVAGAIGKGLTRAALMKLPSSAGGSAAKTVEEIAPSSEVVEGVQVPVSAAQRGSRTAQLAEKFAEQGGAEEQLAASAKTQQAASQRALSATADNVTRAAVGKLDSLAEQSSQLKPLSVRDVLPSVTSFGEGADLIRETAGAVYQKVDELTDGKFTALQDQRAALNRIVRHASEEKVAYEAGEKLKSIDDQINSLLDNYGASPQDKATFTAAKQAWRQSRAMDDVQTAIDRSTRGVPKGTKLVNAGMSEFIDGKALIRRLRAMDSDVLNDAVGGSGFHREALFTLAQTLTVPERASKLMEVYKLSKWAGAVGSAALGHVTPLALKGAEYGLSRFLAAVMTRPQVAQTVERMLRTGSSAGNIAVMVDKLLPAPQATNSDAAANILGGGNQQ